MADLSKIKLNGTTYDFKDAVARPFVVRVWEDETTGELTTDKTYAEILAALQDGHYNIVCAEEYFEEEYAAYYQLQSLDNGYTGDDLAFNFFKSENITSPSAVFVHGYYISSTDEVGIIYSWQPIAITETDPTVPAWAKASSKPTYTAAEVGAEPFITTITTGYSSGDNEYWYNSTKTMAQIREAYNNNKICYAIYNNKIFYLTKAQNNDVVFAHYSDDKLELLKLTNSNTSSLSFYKTTDVITISKSASDNTDGYVLFAANNQSGTLTAVNTKRVSLTYNSSNHTDTFKISGGETYNGDSFLGQLGLGYGTNTTYLKSGYISSNVTLTLPSSTGTLALTSQIPTVHEWAMAENKPTYTYSEVGAAASNHTHTQIYTGSGSEVGRVSTTTSSVTMTATGESPSGSSLTNSLTLTPSQTSIYNLRTPTNDKDAANKKYVDDKDTIKTTAGAETTEYNLIGTATSNANTTAVSVYNPGLLSFAKYTNNYARLTVGDTATPGIIRIYSSASSASGFTDLKSNASSTNERTITFPDASGTVALTTDIPSISSWALASSKPSYTFSELTSHPTTLSGYGITDAYTKTEVDGLVSGVLHYKGTKATVSALPSSGNTTGDVWHITADGSEYAWDGSAWQELGTTVDLSGYVPTSRTVNGKALTTEISLSASDVSALPSNTTYVSTFNGQSGAITYTAPVTSVNGQTGAVTITIPTDVSDLNNDAGYLTSYTETDPTVPSWAKASSKPSYTASEVGAAASTHAHGNITSGGDITTTATIASGDRIVINDESASKVTNSSITFGSSTTQYLANNGTWQNVPSAYDDTALAARVTALEQIPWVTYYTGQNAPSNSQGSNGDLYLQTSSS